MNKIVFLILTMHSILCYSQQNGIAFENSKSWSEVLMSAQSEQKFIFVDCFATWCVPCKKMDKIVYVNDSIGEFFNRHFISVKVQMDTGKNDNSQTARRYAEARTINHKYNIASYPTFLFLSPDGDIVHKGTGFKNVQQFLALAEDALDSTKQYYTTLKKFNSGKMDFQSMPKLAAEANMLKEYDQSSRISSTYIDNYLAKLDDERLFKKNNINFLIRYTRSSTGSGFPILFNNEDKISRIMGTSTYIQSLIHYIIYREEILPKLNNILESSSKTPNWDKLKFNIEKKYGQYYAERTVLDAKIRWNGSKKNWNEHAKYIVRFVTKFKSSLTNGDLNDYAWNVVQYSTNKEDIKSAELWMKTVVKNDTDSLNVLPNSWDTYANLLYKLGAKEEAIAAEEEALELSLKFNLTWITDQFRKTLQKMKQNETIIW